MSTSGKTLEQRVSDLEYWRDHQITRDTVTVTRFEEQFGAVHAKIDDLYAGMAGIRASIGDLDGRSVASRLISMNVDISNLVAGQEEINARLGVMDGRFEAMDARFETVDARFQAMDVRFDAMDARFEAMDARFEAMDVRMASVETNMIYLRSDVAQILHILRNPYSDN
ncbi:hypothetical protein DFR70_105457 [Nocardia tenerifensis]|uniref:Uncharacterized protein n=1 Tax=Nocardia tenerifensis TaxID=228006 RepID=A0A318K005_9NOCA|nr:hypothetical protein DFR70_105457 [Nocardia tenerifensis]